MKLKDFLLYLPRWGYSTAVKHIRTRIPEEMKEYIQENHLYHITKDEETVQKIIDSGYLKPASGMMKYIDSYGSPVACMFAGTPSSDDYIKNLTDADINKNPYLNPTMIAHGIEIDIKYNELEKFRTRLLADGVIIYKGKCNLPEDRVKKVQLVPDLCIDKESGNKSIVFRKRTEKEIEESPNKYLPSQEYLQYVLEERQKLGYTQSKVNNLVNTILHQQKIEADTTNRNIKYNLIDVIKGRIKNLFQKKLPSTGQESKLSKNDENPYEKFRKANVYMGKMPSIENISKKQDNVIDRDISKGSR